MDDELPIGFFDLRRQLDEAGVFHRVGSLRDETVLVEVRLPTSFWEIEFHSDATVEYEVFRSTGAILDAVGFIALVVQHADRPVPRASLDRQLSELNVMRLLREAGISFCADEMLMRKVTVEGAVMIEVAVPGERWEIDVLPSGEIEVERFRSEVGVHDFDAEALRRLLATAAEAAPHRRKGLRGCMALTPTEHLIDTAFEKPEYFHPEPHSRAALETEFNSGDPDRIHAAFLHAAYYEDAAWVQAKAIEALTSPVAVVRWGALAALQILAAVHKALEPTVVVPAVMPLTDDSDNDVREVAKDVLSDIKTFFGQ